MSAHAFRSLLTLSLVVSLGASIVVAQSLGTAGTVLGTVNDPAGAVVPDATVTLANSVTGFRRDATTDAVGKFRFNDVPPNVYDLSVSASGFATSTQRLDIRTPVPLSLTVALSVSGGNEVVDVVPGMVENVPTTHTDVDRTLIARLPITEPGAGLSQLITLASPGVAADSNGFYHPLGDHAQSSIVLDNQPITDQQSKAFSTSLPVNAIQSLEVVTGAANAEYGDKTSLVVNAITRSGLSQRAPTGEIHVGYGSFGTTDVDASLAYGRDSIGNFVAFNAQRSGRFLDAPEFATLHDGGSATSLFDRVDWLPSPADTLHLNLFFARNDFDIPNNYDQQTIGQDQHQYVRSINIAPGYVHIFGPSLVLTINPYFRADQVRYAPSGDPFQDLNETFGQSRRLTNAGVRADLAFNKGIHNAKFGVQAQHTFLTEAFQFAITDPGLNDPAGDDFLPGLAPYDLTRGGGYFVFRGHTDVKQESAYAQDAITIHDLTLNLGLRFDNYDGISHKALVEPRLGASYHIAGTNTVLRGSYTRSLETPYNENLILSSATGAGGLGDGILGDATSNPLEPGRRNQYNVGFQQGIGRLVVADVDYFWKYTRNAYDFNVILDTPLTFPISWSQSKIDGLSLRVNLTDYHGLTAYWTAGHSRARYFPPETGGLFFNSDLPEGVFRIDHDQAFQQTTNVRYQANWIRGFAPWANFTWRYDSGLVAGAVPDFATALGLDADQQAQIGLYCGDTFATPGRPLTEADCTSSVRGAVRLQIPADGTAQDDHNPPRIAPRNLFDLAVGTDNLFRSDRRRVTLRLSALNLTNEVALYNFLSTFSGTHFVSPRTLEAQIGFTF